MWFWKRQSPLTRFRPGWIKQASRARVMRRLVAHIDDAIRQAFASVRLDPRQRRYDLLNLPLAVTHQVPGATRALQAERWRAIADQLRQGVPDVSGIARARLSEEEALERLGRAVSQFLGASFRMPSRLSMDEIEAKLAAHLGISRSEVASLLTELAEQMPAQVRRNAPPSLLRSLAVTHLADPRSPWNLFSPEAAWPGPPTGRVTLNVGDTGGRVELLPFLAARRILTQILSLLRRYREAGLPMSEAAQALVRQADAVAPYPAFDAWMVGHLASQLRPYLARAGLPLAAAPAHRAVQREAMAEAAESILEGLGSFQLRRLPDVPENVSPRWAGDLFRRLREYQDLVESNAPDSAEARQQAVDYWLNAVRGALRDPHYPSDEVRAEAGALSGILGYGKSWIRRVLTEAEQALGPAIWDNPSLVSPTWQGLERAWNPHQLAQRAARLAQQLELGR